MATPTHRHVFARLQECVLAKDWRALGDLVAPDALVDFPLAPPTSARCRGRDAIRAAAREAWGTAGLVFDEFGAATLHGGRGGEVLFAEVDLGGRAGGVPFFASLALVLRVREGRIASLVASEGAAHAGPPSGPRERGADTADEQKRLVRRYFEMWNTGDGAIADDVLGAAYVDNAHPALVGPAAVRALVPRFRAQNPDAHMTIEAMVAEADLVAVRNSVRRSHPDEPGRQTATQGMAIFRVAGGRLVEQWSAYIGSAEGPLPRRSEDRPRDGNSTTVPLPWR